MDMTLFALLKAAGVDFSSVAVVMLLWRISTLMNSQKEAIVRLIHKLDKRVIALEAKSDVSRPAD
ncbi:hypothetical protein [Shewanella atlantica]|uniref:Uncharacterized protein n=1 Tax=Shewanella atlantica TaxID=271099 RepID=A0A431WDZ3_9GAMM|nr:hypothetical protein [Shewanella atlantica]RTR33531.1 hypothetical protein EKG39_07350 [Shewanella atlantica]